MIDECGTSNRLAQPCVLLLATAGLAFPPGVIRTDRDIQHSTEQSHCTPFPLLFYEGVLRFGSCVKIPIAFFKISRSWRKISFSRRSRRISSSVAFRRPCPGNAASPSCLALRTHCLSSPSDSPNSRSTSAIDRPLLAASSTASLLNSLLYVRRVVLIVFIASIGSVKDLSLLPPNRGNITSRLFASNRSSLSIDSGSRSEMVFVEGLMSLSPVTKPAQSKGYGIRRKARFATAPHATCLPHICE